MKRTASMDLDWKRDDEWDEWYANLPAIPGYYGTQTEGNAQVSVQPIGDGYGFDIFIIRTYDLGVAGVDHIQLDNRNFGIPNTDTAEEMMDIVEERLTVEDIADALQAEGWMPNVDVAAARKASKRTASLDLDWKPNVDGDTYTAILPDVPGFPVQDPSNWSTHCAQVFQWPDGWHFQISLLIQRPQDLATMDNDDFGIPNGASAEEMMQAVDNLNMDDIVYVLRQWGFLPVEED